jgi:signal transduction histidine kinase
MNAALAALASQLDALLDISKLDAGIEPVNHSNVNLCLLLARLVHEFTLSATDKGLELKLSAPPDSYVHTDEMLFERIIRNLLSNAIKYTERGSIELVVSQSGAKYLLKIIDTGAGIAEEDQSKIFEEFYQLHNPGRDHSRGLGLGLSIVRRLVDLLAIELLMSSSVDKGTTFTLMLEQVKTRPFKEQGLI